MSEENKSFIAYTPTHNSQFQKIYVAFDKKPTWKELKVMGALWE